MQGEDFVTVVGQVSLVLSTAGCLHQSLHDQQRLGHHLPALVSEAFVQKGSQTHWLQGLCRRDEGS